jgi:transposase
MRPIPSSTKQSILSLLQQGESTRFIAERCGVSKTKVQELRQEHLRELPVPKRGRPQKLSSQNKRLCVRAITSGKLKTAVNVAKMLREDMKINVNRMTVTRALKEAGLDSAEMEAKPMLSAKNIKARLAFARKHRDWTIEDWKRVIWSDETKINRFNSDGRTWYWKRDGTDVQSHHVKQTVKHGGGSLMIWGCMTWNGPGFMCKIDGKMDKDLYKSILEDELLRYAAISNAGVACSIT